MYTLAIETATDAGSVAITENGNLSGQVLLNQRFSQSRNLVQSIEYLLQCLNLQAERMDGIAVSIGPGSYTGLRIGLSVAKSLSFALDKPLAGVNSLDALAHQGSGQNQLLCPLIRFRKEEYYSAFYRWNGEELQRQSEYQVHKIKELLAEIKEEVVFIGILRSEDEQEISQSRNGFYINGRFAEAYWVARLGEKLIQRGMKENIHSLTPFYMHDFPLNQ